MRVIRYSSPTKSPTLRVPSRLLMKQPQRLSVKTLHKKGGSISFGWDMFFIEF